MVTEAKPVIRFRAFTVPAIPGCDLLGLLLAADAPISYLCMAGSCRHCRVRVVSGMEHLRPLGVSERRQGLRPDERLACQSVVTGTGDVVIEQE